MHARWSTWPVFETEARRVKAMGIGQYPLSGQRQERLHLFLFMGPFIPTRTLIFGART
jgi:hypothetical protein